MNGDPSDPFYKDWHPVHSQTSVCSDHWWCISLLISSFNFLSTHVYRSPTLFLGITDSECVSQYVVCVWLSGLSGLGRNPETGNHLIFWGVGAPRHFFPSIFFNFFSQKSWKNMIYLDPKCLNIHSHLDLKSLSFSTESTNVLLPTPWNFLTSVSHVRRPPWDTTSSWRGLTSVRGKSVTWNSFELTNIVTETLVSSVPTEGSHSWNVSPDKSSATRFNHNSKTRVLSPSEYLVTLYSSHLWSCNSNFFSTEVMILGTVPNLQIQKCPGRMLGSKSSPSYKRSCLVSTTECPFVLPLVLSNIVEYLCSCVVSPSRNMATHDVPRCKMLEKIHWDRLPFLPFGWSPHLVDSGDLWHLP